MLLYFLVYPVDKTVASYWKYLVHTLTGPVILCILLIIRSLKLPMEFQNWGASGESSIRHCSLRPSWFKPNPTKGPRDLIQNSRNSCSVVCKFYASGKNSFTGSNPVIVDSVAGLEVCFHSLHGTSKSWFKQQNSFAHEYLPPFWPAIRQ